MIDIHCHILPNVDDGARNIADSLQMVQAAAAEGISVIAATPHHQNGRYINVRGDIIDQVHKLNSAIEELGIDLIIKPGQEVRLYGDLIGDLEDGCIMPVNDSKYILIEFPSSSVPAYADRLLYDLQLKGYTPVIVHPERNSELIEKPDKLYKLIQNGALSQVTAGSLNGRFGKKIKQFSFDLIEFNLAHVIASDAHNITSRGFGLTKAYDSIEFSFGADIAGMLSDNAHNILCSNKVTKEQPLPIVKKKKLFGLF